MLKCVFIPIILMLASTTKLVNASTLFVPDEDTIALIELVTLTASQLNELEKLVTNAEKYTEKLQKYNEIVQDHYYRTLLINDIVNDFYRMKDIDVNNLGDFNEVLRQAIFNGRSLKEYVALYSVREHENEKMVTATVRKDKRLQDDELRARLQADRSFKNSNIHVNQIIAQNTGKNYQETVKLHRTTNKLLNKQAELNAAKDDEMKKKKSKEKEKEEFYGVATKSRAEIYRERIMKVKKD